jgi:hypothetical protein
MWENVRRHAGSWMWLVLTVGSFVVLDFAIFIAFGVPAFNAPWGAARP